MTDATELDEAAVRARLEAATEGPWRVVVDHHRGHDVPDVSVWSDTAGVYVTEDVVFAGSQFPANAEFIAHARTDVGLLLTALDEARERAATWDEVDRLSHENLLKERDEARAQVERLHFDLDREARARQAAEGAVTAVRALLDDTPVPCACAENRYPGYIDDENWEPEWPGDTRSLTGRGYLDCPWCDGAGNRTPYMPSREELLAALATPTTPEEPS